MFVYYDLGLKKLQYVQEVVTHFTFLNVAIAIFNCSLFSSENCIYILNARSLDPFDIVAYNIKWDKISGTYSIFGRIDRDR